jgi:hypothetical protein
MRETRSSGSVEGVMGDHNSYSDLLLLTADAAKVPRKSCKKWMSRFPGSHHPPTSAILSQTRKNKLLSLTR